MKFKNRKCETVTVDLSANGEFNEPIWAQSGAGLSFVSTSAESLKESSQEAPFIPLDSEGNMQVVDVGPMTQVMNDTFHNAVKPVHKSIEAKNRA
jgi:hypothetical protein